MEPDVIAAIQSLQETVDHLGGILYAFCLVQTIAIAFFFGLSRP